MDSIISPAKVEENVTKDKNLSLVLVDDTNLNIVVQPYTHLTIDVIFPNQTDKPLSLSGRIDVKEGASLSFTGVDFSPCDVSFNLSGDLDKFSHTEYHLASACLKKSHKTFDVRLKAKEVETYSLVKMEGVLSAKGSELVFLGVTDILKGAKKSWARQESRIAELASDGKAQCSPMLNIYENDIKASHGAALGKIDDSTLYYLMSRGLDKEQATRLITIGYLKPIISRLQDEKKKEEFLSLVSSKEL